MVYRDQVTMSDVADPALCHFCGSYKLEWIDFGWADCHECSASIKYSKRRGEVVDTEPPKDLKLVSKLLHELRGVKYNGS